MMITQSLHGAARLTLIGRIRDVGAATSGAIATWVNRIRQREMLAGLDERMLRDIGLTPDAHAREVTKPFWRE